MFPCMSSPLPALVQCFTTFPSPHSLCSPVCPALYLLWYNALLPSRPHILYVPLYVQQFTCSGTMLYYLPVPTFSMFPCMSSSLPALVQCFTTFPSPHSLCSPVCP